MRRFSLAVLLAVAATTCAKDELTQVVNPPEDPTEVPDTCQTGGITGHVCLPGNDRPLEGARVYVVATNCNAVTESYEITTGEDGEFAIADVPAGSFDLQIESSAYSTTIPVRVDPGEITTVIRDASGALLCEAPPNPRVAVITGAWDEVNVLLDELAIPYDIYDGGSGGASEANELLSDFEALSEYDALFVNCGYMDRDFLASEVEYDYYSFGASVTFDFNAVTYQNLRQFVANGGSVYASDWAWPIAEAIKPDVIDFYGNENADGYEVTKGVEGATNGNIQDGGMESFLGTDQVQIDLDLPSWAVINNASAGAEVYVRGDVSVYADEWGTELDDLYDKPLIVGFSPFSGGGYVIYTTFHYHSQPTAEMLDVLRYLIFQL